MSLLLAAISGFIAYKLGGSGPVLIATTAIVGFGIAPVLETTWRRIHGPYRELEELYGRACLRVEDLEAENLALRHPAPLDVHVGRFTVEISDQEDTRKYLKGWIVENDADCRAVTVLGLEITNRTLRDMAIDCRVRLALKTRSRRGGMFIELDHGYISDLYRDFFHDGALVVPADRPVSVDKVFALDGLSIIMAGGRNLLGLDNISDTDAHVLVLTDRVTGRSREVAFGLSLGLGGSVAPKGSSQ